MYLATDGSDLDGVKNGVLGRGVAGHQRALRGRIESGAPKLNLNSTPPAFMTDQF